MSGHVLALSGGLTDLLWSFAPDVPRPPPGTQEEISAVTPESTAMARALRAQGFRFVGPTTAYALMQATGMVDDHVASCWRRGVSDRSAGARSPRPGTTPRGSPAES